MRDAVPSPAAAVVVTIPVPPVMTTTGAPTLARNKCTGACSNQSADGSATAAAGYSTDESTAERTATYLRRGRLRQNQENNRRYDSDCCSDSHSFSPVMHEHKKRMSALRHLGSRPINEALMWIKSTLVIGSRILQSQKSHVSQHALSANRQTSVAFMGYVVRP
jgi:hypothetical protein